MKRFKPHFLYGHVECAKTRILIGRIFEFNFYGRICFPIRYCIYGSHALRVAARAMSTTLSTIEYLQYIIGKLRANYDRVMHAAACTHAHKIHSFGFLSPSG